MKKLKYLSFGFAAVILLSMMFVSCDQIDPIVPLTIRYNSDKYGPAPTFTSAPMEMRYQHALIEDFTGHTCGNCPAAAIIAEDVLASYPDKVHVIAIHAGDFADVHEDHYTVDWTCPDGDVLWAEVAEQINPTGRINRAPDKSATSFYTTWEADAVAFMAEDPTAVVQIQATHHHDEAELNVHVNTEFLADYEGKAKMSVVITESHLIGDQKDYSQDPELVEDYEFNHLMRGTVNGATGIQISDAPRAGDVIQNDYTVFFNPDWVVENCHLVAIVFDSETGKVINLAEYHLGE